MDKIAIISDIHGNYEALITVLKDIKRQQISEIYCLGDIVAKGTHQQECADLIRENCQVVIRGNCDQFFLEPTHSHPLSEADQKRIAWIQGKLRPGTRQYLLNLPYCYEFYLSGRLVRLIHAHPEFIYKSVGNVDLIENYYELFLPSANTVSDQRADLLSYGHIHTPFAQKIYNRIILNPGSVGDALDAVRNPAKDGDPRNTTVANYLILSGQLGSHDFSQKLTYEFISLPYDIDKELSSNTDNPEYTAYANEITQGHYRNPAKLQRYFEQRGINQHQI